jgi:hypothetical protein
MPGHFFQSMLSHENENENKRKIIARRLLQKITKKCGAIRQLRNIRCV